LRVDSTDDGGVPHDTRGEPERGTGACVAVECCVRLYEVPFRFDVRGGSDSGAMTIAGAS